MAEPPLGIGSAWNLWSAGQPMRGLEAVQVEIVFVIYFLLHCIRVHLFLSVYCNHLTLIDPHASCNVT